MLSNAIAGPSKQRLRAYKACENCRLRKIRCTGEIPCPACISAEIADKCTVRNKAKPNRALPLKISGRSDAGPSKSPTSEAEDRLGPATSNQSPSLGLSPSVRADFTLGTATLSPAAAPTYSFSYPEPSPHPTHPSPQYAPSDQHASPTTGLNVLGSSPSVSSVQAGPYVSHGVNPARRRNPLDVLEDRLQIWCQAQGVPFGPLIFHDEPRIGKIESTVLPTGQALIDFEDRLMGALVTAEDLDRLEVLDCPRLLNMYSRYRALPTSLTDDQTALIYASLCMARFTQLRGGVATGMTEPHTLAREDVTYYRMARAALASWGRASITSMWALFCLTTYIQINGSAGEHGEVLALSAWQIRALGLHRRETAQLYAPQDMSGPLLQAYCYSETLRAVMTDLSPSIPIAELELPLESCVQGVNAAAYSAHLHAINYLRDWSNHQIDVTTAGYLAVAEEAWSEDLDGIRAQHETGFDKVRRGWAEMRFHWLRLLLHLPRMSLSPGRANQATIYSARSVISILNIHTEAAFIGKLDPSWPQLKRIITCGQVLVLCCARGEVQQLEGADLFTKLIALLEAHVEFWPVVYGAIEGYRQAAGKLGIHLATGDQPTAGVTNDFAPFQLDDDAAGWFLDLDLGTFAQDMGGVPSW